MEPEPLKNSFRDEISRRRRRDVQLAQIVACNDQLFVRKLKPQAISAGGIETPQATENCYGLVINSGSVEFHANDMVLWRSHAGMPIDFPDIKDGSEYEIIDSRDVLARVRPVEGGVNPEDFHWLPAESPGAIQGPAAPGAIQGDSVTLEYLPSDAPGAIQGNPIELVGSNHDE